MPIIKRAENYRWTCRHPVGQRDGATEYLTFDVQFRSMPQSTVTELLAKAQTGELANKEFIEQAMVGWHDMKQPDGSAMEFSVDRVLELCELYPGMAASLSRAWAESVIGGAVRKN